MSLTKVNMKFPRRRAPVSVLYVRSVFKLTDLAPFKSEFLTNTLVDGVLVEDQDHGHKVLRFLAFDIIVMEVIELTVFTCIFLPTRLGSSNMAAEARETITMSTK